MIHKLTCLATTGTVCICMMILIKFTLKKNMVHARGEVTTNRYFLGRITTVLCLFPLLRVIFKLVLFPPTGLYNFLHLPWWQIIVYVVLWITLTLIIQRKNDFWIEKLKINHFKYLLLDILIYWFSDQVNFKMLQNGFVVMYTSKKHYTTILLTYKIGKHT